LVSNAPNNYLVARNGSVVGGISSVIELYYKNRSIYAEVTGQGQVGWGVWLGGTTWTNTFDPTIGSPVITPPVAPPSGPTPTFADDFTSSPLSLYNTRNPGAGGTWQPSLWYAADGHALNGGWELNPFNPATVVSTLYTASASRALLGVQQTPPFISSACGNQPFIAAEMQTSKSFRQLNGYFEIRCAVPRLAGTTAAFWLMNDQTWPPEIDVFEIVDGGVTFTVWSMDQTIAATWHNYQNSAFSGLDTTQFHSYGLDWTSSTMTLYIDRQLAFSTSTPSGYNTALFPIVGMEVGDAGSWGGAITNPSALPVYLQVDSIKVWNSRPF
jgi:beta-glucanase (GH16 family)